MSPDTCTLATIQRIGDLVKLFTDEHRVVAEGATAQGATDQGATDQGVTAQATAMQEVTAQEVTREQFRPAPYLVTHDGEPLHFHYVPALGPPLEHVGASCAMALSIALVDGHDQRLGLCAAPDCARVFFDRSRNRNQRFCRKSCATRVHVAAHRARK